MHILIVDDDENFLRVLESVLREEKHDVTTAHNGLEAIENCRKQRFDLVISDLYMPSMDGLELVRRIRAMDTPIPIVIATSERSQTVLSKLLDAGAESVLSKPVRKDRLKEALDAAVSF